MISRAVSKIVAVNTISDAVIDKPQSAYTKMVEASPDRQMWFLNEGDSLLTAREIPKGVRDYICDLLHLDQSKIRFLTPATQASDYLLDNVMSDQELLRALAGPWPGAKAREQVLMPFVMDDRAVRLAEALGARMAHYGALDHDYGYLNHVASATVHRLNAKSCFREVTSSLGLPVADGIHVRQRQELSNAVHMMLARHRAVIVKQDRASNGYDHTVVRDWEWTEADTIKRCDVPQVVEEFFEHGWAPSIELEINQEGPQVLYLCDQRRRGNSWSGMVIPPRDIPSGLMKDMIAGALAFGSHLHECGYRGICDVDCLASADGGWVVTETNLRVTGGTHVHAMLSRLVGSSYFKFGYALTESVELAGRPFTSWLEEIQRNQILFDQRRLEGVILTADGILTDGRLRYVIYAGTHQRAVEIETALINL